MNGLGARLRISAVAAPAKLASASPASSVTVRLARRPATATSAAIESVAPRMRGDRHRERGRPAQSRTRSPARPPQPLPAARRTKRARREDCAGGPEVLRRKARASRRSTRQAAFAASGYRAPRCPRRRRHRAARESRARLQTAPAPPAARASASSTRSAAEFQRSSPGRCSVPPLHPIRSLGGCRRRLESALRVQRICTARSPDADTFLMRRVLCSGAAWLMHLAGATSLHAQAEASAVSPPSISVPISLCWRLPTPSSSPACRSMPPSPEASLMVGEASAKVPSPDAARGGHHRAGARPRPGRAEGDPPATRRMISGRKAFASRQVDLR